MAKFATKMRDIDQIENYRLANPDTSAWPKEIEKSIKSIKKDVLKAFEFQAKKGDLIYGIGDRTIESTVGMSYLSDDAREFISKTANEIFGPYGIKVTVVSCYATTIKLSFELE